MPRRISARWIGVFSAACLLAAALAAALTVARPRDAAAVPSPATPGQPAHVASFEIADDPRLAIGEAVRWIRDRRRGDVGEPEWEELRDLERRAKGIELPADELVDVAAFKLWRIRGSSADPFVRLPPALRGDEGVRETAAARYASLAHALEFDSWWDGAAALRGRARVRLAEVLAGHDPVAEQAAYFRMRPREMLVRPALVGVHSLAAQSHGADFRDRTVAVEIYPVAESADAPIYPEAARSAEYVRHEVGHSLLNGPAAAALASAPALRRFLRDYAPLWRAREVAAYADPAIALAEQTLHAIEARHALVAGGDEAREETLSWRTWEGHVLVRSIEARLAAYETDPARPALADAVKGLYHELDAEIAGGLDWDAIYRSSHDVWLAQAVLRGAGRRVVVLRDAEPLPVGLLAPVRRRDGRWETRDRDPRPLDGGFVAAALDGETPVLLHRPGAMTPPRFDALDPDLLTRFRVVVEREEPVSLGGRAPSRWAPVESEHGRLAPLEDDYRHTRASLGRIRFMASAAAWLLTQISIGGPHFDASQRSTTR